MVGMNRKTIAFMQVLYEYDKQNPTPVITIKEELLRILEQYKGFYGLSGAGSFSSRSEELLRCLERWKKKAEAMEEPKEANDLMVELKNYLEQIGKAELETKEECERIGAMEPEKIHFVPGVIRQAFFEKCLMQMQIESLRILLYGTKEMFESLPMIRELPNDIDQIYFEYKEQIYPLASTCGESGKAPVWAYQKAARRGASRWYLPVFFHGTPEFQWKERCPGEVPNINILSVEHTEGRGRISNVTIRNLPEAQKMGIVRELPERIRPEYFDSPYLWDILRAIFEGQYYAVEADDLFCYINKYLLFYHVYERRQKKQCFFCGEPVTGKQSFCETCMRKLEERYAH